MASPVLYWLDCCYMSVGEDHLWVLLHYHDSRYYFLLLSLVTVVIGAALSSLPPFF